MQNEFTIPSYVKQHPMLVGVFGVLAVMLIGSVLAVATGFVRPALTSAQVVTPVPTPPCCSVPTPTPTPTPPPPVPAPVPVIPPVVPEPEPTPAAPVLPPLVATCSAGPATVSIGQVVTWNVIASGADGIYTYSWSGDEGISNTNPSFGFAYSSSGTKNAQVTVTGGGETVTTSCSVAVEEVASVPPLAATCSASPASASIGQVVTWNVVASGANGIYTYAWSGTDGLTGTNPSQGYAYASAGAKTASVTVTSGTETVTANCAATVATSGGGGTPPAPACTLSITPASITVGDTATLTWTATDATFGYIDNGVGNVTPIGGGTVSVSPTTDTTYTYTVGSTSGPDNTCTANISVGTSGGGGGTTSSGGGGGHGRRSSVTLDFLKLPAEAPFASVYLAQIPYTGLSLSGFGLILYWLGLVGIVGLLAYLVLFKVFPACRSFAERLIRAVQESPVVAHVPEKVDVPVPAVEPPTPAPVEQPKEVVHKDETIYSPFHGFRSFGSSEKITIDDIVKGLSRLPVPEFVESASDSIASVATAGTNMVKGGYRALVKALMARDRDAAFAALRSAVSAGETPEKVMTQTVCALDDVYRKRIDGALCDPELEELCAPCETPELEHLVSSLTTAVDASYSTGTTAAKLALVRALDAKK